MVWIRSLLFNLAFYVNLVLFLILGSSFYFTPRTWSIAALKTWARVSLWLLRVIAGTSMEVRGREHIPRGAALVAGKHQSMWETFALLPLVDDPAMVLKRELTFIPFFGWFIYKFRMIPVERTSGATALRRMMNAAEAAARDGRQIIIFPEGTRRTPGDPPDYKPGAAALYMKLGIPCVPVALNSGVFWQRRKFLRFPGKIVVEFLPALPSGLPRREFTARLISAIEDNTSRLVNEAKLGYK
jgi:1-acyl-sn-glycerol-3-phosphate acyltransferase